MNRVGLNKLCKVLNKLDLFKAKIDYEESESSYALKKGLQLC